MHTYPFEPIWTPEFIGQAQAPLVRPEHSAWPGTDPKCSWGAFPFLGPPQGGLGPESLLESARLPGMLLEGSPPPALVVLKALGAPGVPDESQKPLPGWSLEMSLRGHDSALGEGQSFVFCQRRQELGKECERAESEKRSCWAGSIMTLIIQLQRSVRGGSAALQQGAEPAAPPPHSGLAHSCTPALLRAGGWQ